MTATERAIAHVRNRMLAKQIDQPSVTSAETVTCD